jgi:DNA-binding HxlR family transcriptional regulator
MFGDMWSLLIIRDIVYLGKKTYGEFVASGENIARNILASRLLQLEENGILTKKPHPRDGRKEIYELTEKGLDLIPILLDMADWGYRNNRPTDTPASWFNLVRANRQEMASRLPITLYGVKP